VAAAGAARDAAWNRYMQLAPGPAHANYELFYIILYYFI
jgi:hypothetical protein